MKKYISCFLCLVIVVTSICSCSYKEAESTDVSGEVTQEVIPEVSETTEVTEEIIETEITETETEPYVKKESHYTFKTHVSSTLMNEIMGEDMLEGYNNLVDAVLNGEDSFECKDEYTFKWVMGQFPYLLFPVVAEYLCMDEYRDGRGYFHFTIPDEEFQEKLQEFETVTVDILNSCLEDDYSDFEKALALYLYFIKTYVYDYDTYDAMRYEYQENISGYRLLMGETGICQEISVAYSYLLLQAGVDATVLKAVRGFDNEPHQWSLVTIDGKYYHIDPTYGLGLLNSLDYFMMTDEIRAERDSYDPKEYIPSTVYAQDHEYPDISVTDDTYSDLWGVYIYWWKPEENEIIYYDEYNNEQVFNYGDV